MRTWDDAPVPQLPGAGGPVRIFDVKSQALQELPTEVGAVYACGITPYDATHLGHAATYLALDTMVRTWRDSGATVRTAMNSTDVDDPLLERAARDGVDWERLAQEQQDLFRADMTALGVRPTDHWIAVTEHIAPIADAVLELLDSGDAYRVPTPDSVTDGPLGQDVYFDSSVARSVPLGASSHTDRDTMLAWSAERGGDPDRAGKRDPLDPLLWRAERAGEPAWDSVVGRGRPGWHIECTVIATDALGMPFTVAFGGSDLRFPHQEFQGQHALALGAPLFSALRANAGMVGYQGEKMSKSLGNLVKVSELRAGGIDPLAIRLALLAHHWRADWEWRDGEIHEASERLDRWRAWAAQVVGDPEPGHELLAALRGALADDLDTPLAVRLVDRWVASRPADALALDAIHALLGIPLR